MNAGIGAAFFFPPVEPIAPLQAARTPCGKKLRCRFLVVLSVWSHGVRHPSGVWSSPHFSSHPAFRRDPSGGFSGLKTSRVH